jgi:hypothetical protein
MSYYAHFERHEGHLFRLDTHVYLNGVPSDPSAGVCVGGFVGINPGSAKAAKEPGWHQLEQGRDQVLPRIYKRFRAAYDLAHIEVPVLAYVRVWNLFYLREPDCDQAIRTIRSLKETHPCDSEKWGAPIIWFGWGAPIQKLNDFKGRFLNIPCQHAFFCRARTGDVVDRIPKSNELAYHPLFLKAAPVVAHLATLL